MVRVLQVTIYLQLKGIRIPCARKTVEVRNELNTFDVFAQQFTLWFLPWFTLLAQIPYASSRIWDDLLVTALSVGSPTTAPFSLFVTMLDRIWLLSKCETIKRTFDVDDTSIDDITRSYILFVNSQLR